MFLFFPYYPPTWVEQFSLKFLGSIYKINVNSGRNTAAQRPGSRPPSLIQPLDQESSQCKTEQLDMKLSWTTMEKKCLITFSIKLIFPFWQCKQKKICSYFCLCLGCFSILDLLVTPFWSCFLLPFEALHHRHHWKKSGEVTSWKVATALNVVIQLYSYTVIQFTCYTVHLYQGLYCKKRWLS